jgi:hypothetical protein
MLRQDGPPRCTTLRFGPGRRALHCQPRRALHGRARHFLSQGLTPDPLSAHNLRLSFLNVDTTQCTRLLFSSQREGLIA